MNLPKPVQEFIDAFSELPSLGPRQATRLAFRLIRQGPSTINRLAKSAALLGKIKICSQCFFIHDQAGPLCSICTDTKREQDVFLIVEKETDLMSIERSGAYQGRYLVIGEASKSGALEPWQVMRLSVLKKIIHDTLPSKKAREIIIGTNPSTYSDAMGARIKQELQSYADKITFLGRGIPTGGEIEFSDEETLSHALNRRQ